MNECLAGLPAAAPVRVSAPPLSVSADAASLQRRHHTGGHVLLQQNFDTSDSNADVLMFPQVCCTPIDWHTGDPGGGPMALWLAFELQRLQMRILMLMQPQ